MKILITGGTGTIGQALAQKLTEHEITIFSRGEAKQAEMRANFPQFKYLIGDVRDMFALNEAIKGHDVVYHLAALKHVDICEKQPHEAVKSNVEAVMNVIECCRMNDAKLINMSSDKAASPNNVYALTKRLGEQLCLEYGFVSIRSGNVIGSSGSFIQNMISSIKTNNFVTLTDPLMNRFFISVNDIATFLSMDWPDQQGVYLPKMNSFYIINIVDLLVKQYGNKETQIKITGIREGERLNEALNNESECLVNVGYCYRIGKQIGSEVITSADFIGTSEQLKQTFHEFIS